MTENAVKTAAATGRMIRGIHLTFPSLNIIEVLAAANLQFLYIDGEHGCFDWRDIEAACIAAERHGMTAIARVPDGSSATITRFLDRGVRGLVIPHVDSIDKAKAAIDAAYFAPRGNRSFGAGRPNYLAIDDKVAHLADCNDGVSLALMIEDQAGLDLADALARLEGVDYLSFGMMDLAQSLGHAGDPAHEAVRGAAAAASARIRAAGKPVREDFMKFAWITEILIAGAQRLLDS